MTALLCSTESLRNVFPRRERIRWIISGEIVSESDSGPASRRFPLLASALTLRRMAGIISGGIGRSSGRSPPSSPDGHVLREDHPPELVLPVGGSSLPARVDDPPRENLLVVVRVEPDSTNPLAFQDLVELPPFFFHAEPLEGEEEREEFPRCHLRGEVEGGDLLQEEVGNEAADEAVAVGRGTRSGKGSCPWRRRAEGGRTAPRSRFPRGSGGTSPRGPRGKGAPPGRGRSS